MPRNISFSLTTQQFRDRTKWVTRRMGWHKLQAGDVLNGCEKCQGLKRGETVKKLGRIKILSVRREPLQRMTDDSEYGAREVVAEGFPDKTPAEFVVMFCRSHSGCQPESEVTRIEFEYLE